MYRAEIKSTQYKGYGIGHKKTTTSYLKSVANARNKQIL